MTLIADTQPGMTGDARDVEHPPSGEGAPVGAGAPDAAADTSAGRGAAAAPDAAKGDAAEAGGGLGPKGGVIAIPSLLEAKLRAERPAGEAPEAAGARPRPMSARLLDYSAHAAMIVGLIGFAWTVSNHVVSRPVPTAAPAATVPAPQSEAMAKPADAELAALKQDNIRLAADLGALRARVGAMEAAASRQPAQVKALQAAVGSLEGGLAAARSDAASQTASLGARLDKLQRDAAEAALARAERGIDLTTGSLPPGEAHSTAAETAPMPPARPEAARSDVSKTDGGKPDRGERADATGRDADKPPVIPTYVVRDVTRGVALIEGRRGMLEVVPGVSIPGAGVVKSIERRGKGWAVITTRGQLAYAAPLPTWRRDGGRDYYPSYRYDF